MTGGPIYTYHLSGRRPVTVFAFGISLLMWAFVAQYAEPWYFQAPVGLAAAIALWAMIANPQTGSRLSAETLYFYSNDDTETVRIADIATMKVTFWSDGPDTVTLTLTSGRIIQVPSMCADSKLAVMLRELGVSE
jgi:hypothetical protein